MSIGAETVAVMSPGCVTVAVTTGETVSIGAETVAVISAGTAVVTTGGIGETVSKQCPCDGVQEKQCQLEQKLLP